MTFKFSFKKFSIIIKLEKTFNFLLEKNLNKKIEAEAFGDQEPEGEDFGHILASPCYFLFYFSIIYYLKHQISFSTLYISLQPLKSTTIITLSRLGLFAVTYAKFGWDLLDFFFFFFFSEFVRGALL
jgi:hypothetical protein